MANRTSKERNLKLVITGDTADVEKKFKLLQSSAKKAGFTLTSEFKKAENEGKRLIAGLTLVSDSLQKLVDFQTASQSAEGVSAQLTRNKEKEEELALRKKAKLEAEKNRLVKERITKTKQLNRELLQDLRITTAEEKAIATTVANSRTQIRAKAAAKEKAIFRQLQKELAEIEQKAGAGKLVGTAAQQRRLTIQKKYEKQLIDLYRKTGEELSKIPDKVNSILDGHKSWIRHVAEIVGVYRLVNAAIDAVINGIKSIPNIGIELQTTKAVLESTLGSSAATAAVFKALSEEAERTGIEILTLRENFRNLNASMSLAGERTETVWKVFTDLNTVSTALHLTADKTQSVFLAIAQIFNKTKVQSEELVKQLGNLLPGAFASFAAANKKTTSQLIKEMQLGIVTAHDMVANFTDFMAKRFTLGFRIAQQGVQANIGRMNTAFTLLAEKMFRLSESSLTDVIRGITSVVNAFREGLDTLAEFSELIKTIATFIAFRLVTVLLDKLVPALIATKKAISGVKTALAIFTVPGRIIAGIGAIAYAFSTMKDEGKNATTDLLAMIAEIDKKVTDTKPKPIEILIDESPAIKKLDFALDIIKRKLEKQKALLAEGGPRNRRRLEKEEEVRKLTVIYEEGLKAREKLREAERLRIETEQKLQLQREKGLQKTLSEIAEKGQKKGKTLKVKDYTAVQQRAAQELLKLTGQQTKAELLAFNIRMANLKKELAGGGEVSDFLREKLALTEKLGTLEIKRKGILKDLAKEEQFIQAKANAGLISQAKAFDLIQKKRKEALETVKEMIDATEKQLEKTGEMTEAQKIAFENARKDVKLFYLEMVKGAKRPKEEIKLLGTDIRNSLENSFSNSFSAFIRGTRSATQAMADFANSILDSVAKIAANKLAEQLVGLGISLFGSIGGSAYSSSSLSGSSSAQAYSDFSASLGKGYTFANAHGNAFDSSGVIPFASGGVVDSPTLFRFSKGTGLMGEAGPEAILPLKRNSNGDLGVVAEGTSGGNSGVVIQNLTVTVQEKEDSTTEEQAAAIGKALRTQLDTLIDKKLANSIKPGGMLNRTQVSTVF